MRRRVFPLDSEPDRPEWHDALAPFTVADAAGDGDLEWPLFTNSLGAYGAYAAGAVDSARRAIVGAASPDAAERLWRWLGERNGEADRRLAVTTLAHDRNAHNRLVAAAILANFPDRDSTWWALTDAIMDPIDPVTAAAAASLTIMAVRHPHGVDWRPLAPRLNHLLAGANPWELATVMRTLAQTQVDPALAGALLVAGPPGDARQMILDCLASNAKELRDPAHALLSQLHGVDLGTDPAAWAVWLKGLTAVGP